MTSAILLSVLPPGTAELTSRPHPPEIEAAFAALASGRATEAEIAKLAGVEAPRLYVYLESLAKRGLLRFTAVSSGEPLARLVPISQHMNLPSAHLDERLCYRLSRFSLLRFDGPGPALECPTSHARVEIEDHRVLPLLFELARPLSLFDLSARALGLDAPSARAVMELLAMASMLEPAPDGASLPSPSAIALRQWELHDLLFHARSRAGRHDAPFGGTYRFEGEIPPIPAVKRAGSGARIELRRPDIDALRRADIPFTEVLERRRSRRAPSTSLLTLPMLAELLFRSARVRRVLPTPHGELSDRPYPGAGACYELELYPVVRRCEGVPTGLYHYCPEGHFLEPINAAPPLAGALLEGARASAGAASPPEVLIVIAARFQRVSWKYESIAYSLILKDTGVLLQTMVLVATAMGLSACPLGGGDSDLFARAAGTDYYAETSVGELFLGGP